MNFCVLGLDGLYFLQYKDFIWLILESGHFLFKPFFSNEDHFFTILSLMGNLVPLSLAQNPCVLNLSTY